MEYKTFKDNSSTERRECCGGVAMMAVSNLSRPGLQSVTGIVHLYTRNLPAVFSVVPRNQQWVEGNVQISSPDILQ